tara:strand:+ start:45 stop:416 length:372 start_codon:yes stop_codon:yes gene_type:complete
MCDEEVWGKSDHKLCVDVLDMLCDEIRDLRETNNMENEMKDVKPLPHFYTVQQVADLLQIHHQSVTRYIRRGQIKALQISGVYRISEVEVQRILSEGIPNAAPPKKTKQRKKNGTKRSSGSKA